MARSLLSEMTEMTDETTPDTPEEHDRSADRGNGTEAAPPAAAAKQASPLHAAESRGQSPLITAIEIENFKGIGAPVRIDLRPITLLFGRNSAGKSTILHALCYAHEILSHRNVDARKTELGGDQIDLGGFRQFVHGHDLDRAVRLRFELNLESWRVPAPLLRRMTRSEYVEPELAGEFEEWIEVNDPAKLTQTGWVEVAIMRNRFGEKPILYSYEVGVNAVPVGRIQRDDSSSMILAFNWTHPLFDALHAKATAPTHAAVAHVSETRDSKADEWRLHHAKLLGGLNSPLPDWDDLLYPEGDDLEYNDDIDVGGSGSTSLPRFQALVTGVLGGVGRALRDDLARLQYLGPVRELRPRTDAERDSHDQGSWSDGSAAWHLLLHRDPYADLLDGDLLKDVNDWLASDERLDTGYKLRRRSSVELPADEPPVSQIRDHEELFARYRNGEGAVDLDGFVRDVSAIIVKSTGENPDDAAARTRRRHAKLVATIDNLEKGHPPSTVKALVRAISNADVRTTLQLVTAQSGLPVRTSDVGVGISQILPVVVAALDPNRPGITAIEQPELHVHPKMQVELGDLFAQGVDQGGIFLIETHSEHLILRLLRRIEETHGGELPKGKPALKPAQLSVVFVEQSNGEAKATRLRIDETGEFVDRWPRGFFEERDDELF